MDRVEGQRDEKRSSGKESLYRGAEVYQVVGVLFEVYNELGFGLAEEIYHESLEVELVRRGIPFVSKPVIRTYYKGSLLTKSFVPDLVLFDSIILELKSVNALNDAHLGQLLNYLRLTKNPLGIIANFGEQGGLKWRRVIVSELIDHS